MKLPRDLSAEDLIKSLGRFGYRPTRQTGSHVRLSRESPDGEHHLTIPKHDPIKIGTLSTILSDLSAHLGMTKESLLKELLK
jgi:predicted RNA binding protein YcfA (HicA-like mRNA interferase family)